MNTGEANIPTPPPENPTDATNSAFLIIGVMVTAAFVMILNETIVSIALPQLAGIFDVSTATVQWLLSGFLLTMAVVIPTTGFLLNKFSPRTMFLAAVGTFCVGTLLSATATGFTGLLTGRVVQACGTAVMIPLVMTSVMKLVPADRRGAMMGTISIVIGVAPAIGPTVGGAILAALGWEWMFWLVLILAIILLVVAIFRLHVPFEPIPSTLPVGSVLLSGAGFGTLLYGISTLGQEDVVAPSWLFLAVSALLLSMFVARQISLQRSGEPLLDLRTLTFHRYRIGVLLSLVVFMGLLGAGAILLPIFLQNVLGHSPATAGLALLPGGAMMALVSRPAGTWYDRIGAKRLVLPGSIGMMVALGIFASFGSDVPLGWAIATHVLLMGSLGLMMTPLMADSLGALPDSLYSHGSALLATLQQVFGALGSAIFVAVALIMSDVVSNGIPDGLGVRAGFALAAVIAAGGFILSFFVPRPVPPELPFDLA